MATWSGSAAKKRGKKPQPPDRLSSDDCSPDLHGKTSQPEHKRLGEKEYDEPTWAFRRRRRIPKTMPDRKVIYEPRFTFEDYENEDGK